MTGKSGGAETVLVLASTFPRFAGDSTPRFVLDLCKGLQREGDVRCLVLAPHAAGSADAEVLEGVEVRRFRYFYPPFLQTISGQGIVGRIARNPLNALLVPFFLAAEAWETWRLMRSRRPRVVMAHWIVPQGLVFHLVSRLCPGSKGVLICHGGDIALMRNSRLLKALGRRLVAGTRLVAVSGFIAWELERHLRCAPPEVIPMGVDEQRFRRQAQEAPPDARPVLLFAGRLEKKKGVEVLLRAMPAILKGRPDAILRVVGSGTREEDLKTVSAMLQLPPEAVVFEGAAGSERMPGFYREATLLVVPSLNTRYDLEGLPTVLFEAMAAGLPVVASDAGGIAEVVRDGETGILVPQGDPGQLAAGVTRLLNDAELRRRVAENALEQLEQRYTRQRVAQKYLEILRET